MEELALEMGVSPFSYRIWGFEMELGIELKAELRIELWPETSI